MWIEQSVAFSFLAGPFVDNTDGTTPLTALTLAASDITVSKNGTTGNPASITAQSHVADGYYKLTLPSTVPSALGILEVQVSETGALPVPLRVFQVLPSLVYASIILGTDNLQVDAVQLGGTTAATALDTAIDTRIDALETYGDTNWSSSPSANTGTLEGAASTSVTLDADASPSSVDDFYKDAFVEITGGTGAGQGRYITDYVGSTRVATVSEAWAVTPDTSSTYAIYADDLISGGGSLTASDVWSHGTRVLTAGTNIALAKGTGVTGFNDLSAAQVNAEVDTALADYDPPTKAELDTAVDALPTAAENAAALLAATVTVAAPADGSAPNVGQALSLIMGAMGVFKLTRTTTTLTAYANDETTVLATWTLDSAIDPTSRTRAS